MNAIVRQSQSTALAMPEAELITVLRNSLYPGAKDDSVRMVLGYCRARGLDPMKKPVHIVPMYNRDAGGMIDVVMPGVNSYRTDAARTGEYVGKSEPEYGPDTTKTLGGVETTFPLWCKIVVKRLIQGKECEFVAKEYWLENYATKKRDTQAPNDMWLRRPYGQLAKCSEAQALRMAFPEETGGTNTNDEMEGKTFAGTTIDGDVRAEPATRKTSAQVINDEIPDFDKDELRDKADWMVKQLSACSSEMKMVGLQASAPRLLKMLDDAGREDLKQIVVDALAFHAGRFPSEAATDEDEVAA